MSRTTWMQRRRNQRRSAWRRRLEHSFGLRLLVAFSAALAALAVVNRWDQCRHSHLVKGCLWRDAGGVVSVDNLEALSIMTAGFLFILEGGQRRQRQNVEAMELVFNCQQAGVRFSHARNEALEQLCQAGVWMDGLDLSSTNLDDLQMAGVRWRQVNLAGASLRSADLRGADLQGANLQNADLSHADLRDANLDATNLEGATLEGARLAGVQPDQAGRSGPPADPPGSPPPGS